MTSPDDLTARLDQLATGRQRVCDEITTAARARGISAVLMIGSLGRGGGDAFSDLDLILVPGPHATGLDLDRLFGDRVLARVQAPGNAPAAGAYDGLCLAVADTALWLDAYTWPQATAAIPADATPIYDTLDLPHSDLDFIPLITAHTDPHAPVHPGGAETDLLRIAVAAKYLARGHLTRLAAELPDAGGLPITAIGSLLHDLLAAIDEPDLARAVAATAVLVDLAETARTAKGEM